MQIAVIGAGYVGLTTSACLAELGHLVLCHDLDGDRIDRLNKGVMPLYEPALEPVVRNGLANGRLRFTHSVRDAVGAADAVFLCVGTPCDANGGIDLSQIDAAARLTAKPLRRGAVVVIKSTVVVGTCRRVREIIADVRKSLDFDVASNPEFLREGSAMGDFLHPDRIVIGCDDPRSAALLTRLYKPLTDKGAPLLSTTTANAELIKYAANALLALKIGFINDVADLCERTDADVMSVAEGIGLDRRIGPAFLAAGPGFGGSCFPKDTRAFAETGRAHGASQALIETLITQNEHRKKRLAARIMREGELSPGDIVCVLGVAFKAETDDVRESAALSIIPELQAAGIEVQAYDPKAADKARTMLRDVAWADNPYDAARGAKTTVILTEWTEFRKLDLRRLAGAMSGRTLFDFRNLLQRHEAAHLGLRYFSIGRRPSIPTAAPERRIPALSALDQRVAAPRR